MTRILCSFRIWTQKLDVRFSLREVRESLKGLKVGLDDEQTGFLLTLTNPSAKVLKIIGVADFVERMLLYKT
jgi:hypothetical protein